MIAQQKLLLSLKDNYGIFDRFSKQKPLQVPTPKKEDDILNSIVDTINMRGVETPVPREQRGADWVLFGPNNRFPLDLLEYRNSSAIHDSIIEGKTNLISGMGLMFGNTREESDMWIVENHKLVPFYRKLDKVFWLTTRDYLTFGYACFEVIYSMDRSRIVDINWIDASRIACGKKDDGETEVDDFYYCENWSDTRNNPPRKIEGFDTSDKDDVRQLVFIKNDDNNMDYYALPNYYSALKWIKADGLMAEYNLSAISNGFSPSIVLNFSKTIIT